MTLLSLAILSTGTSLALAPPQEAHFSVVLLDRQTLPDPAQMRALLEAEGLRLSPPDQSPAFSEDGVSASFTTGLADGGAVMVALFEEPPTRMRLAFLIDGAFAWRDAAVALSVVKAEALIVGYELPGDLRDQNMTMTQITVAMGKMDGVRGTVWAASDQLWSPQLFEEAASSSEGRLPVALWLGLTVFERDDGRIDVHSRGLESFGYENFLVDCHRDQLPEAMQLIYTASRYVIEGDVELKKKESLALPDGTQLVLGRRRSPILRRQKVLTFALP